MSPSLIAVTWYQVLYLLATLLVLALCALAVCAFCVCFGRILDCMERRSATHAATSSTVEKDDEVVVPMPKASQSVDEVNLSRQATDV